jgi:quinol monooxygenase YgiN
MEGAPHLVLFYEVYDSREAFDAHLQTPHLARFREGFPALVSEERPVRFASRHHG